MIKDCTIMVKLLSWVVIFIILSMTVIIQCKPGDGLTILSKENKKISLINLSYDSVEMDWIGQSPIASNSKHVPDWIIDKDDIILPVDVDGDNHDEILIYNDAKIPKTDRAMGLFNLSNNELALIWMKKRRVDKWSLDREDTVIPVDVNGDGIDEVALFSTERLDSSYSSIMSYINGTMKTMWQSKDSMPGSENECHLGKNDQVLTADLDGNGDEEIIIINVNINPRQNCTICVVDFNGTAPTVIHFAQNFVGRHPGKWYMYPGDRALSMDIDGDGKQELIMIQTRGKWMFVFSFSNNEFQRSCEWNTMIGGKWQINLNDYYIVADTDGDGKDEMIIFDTLTQNREGMTILRIDKSSCNVSIWSTVKKVDKWLIQALDRPIVADLNGDKKDEIIMLNFGDCDKRIGILKENPSTRGLTSTFITGSSIGSWQLHGQDDYVRLKLRPSKERFDKPSSRNSFSCFTSITGEVVEGMSIGELVQANIEVPVDGTWKVMKKYLTGNRTELTNMIGSKGTIANEIRKLLTDNPEILSTLNEAGIVTIT